MVTACTLAFASLLLLAGWPACWIGKVTFLTGLAGFGFSPTDNLVAYMTNDEGART